MISSRCIDNFPLGRAGSSLSDIRRSLKKDLEGIEIFGKKLFEVWINEVAPPQGGTWDSWDVCVQAAKECDVLLVLSNGNAGWTKEDGGIGICHAELMTGLTQAPAKVRLIDLGNVPLAETPEGRRNKRFQDYVNDQSLFRGGTVSTLDELKERVREAVHDAILRLTQAGVRDASKGRYHSGQALDWSKLDFRARRQEITRVLRDTILVRHGSKEEKGHVFVNLSGKTVLIIADAIPAALSVGPAKELVGQPFLHDHELSSSIEAGKGGPIHMIGCHKTATETQATKFLGFPDAILVNAPFGIFVADAVQKIQFAFIANCRDEATTRHGTQRFFEWLVQTGEESTVAERALARARIVEAIAKENR